MPAFDDDFDEPDNAEDDEDDDETIPCPHCLEPVYEDAERCPACGTYLSREDVPKRHAWWLVIGVLLCLAVVLGWVVR
jgi:hypothetical protein